LDTATQLAPQYNQLMSKHRVFSFKPQLRLEWRGQDGQSETEQSDHSASLGDSITSSTQIGFSVHTTPARQEKRGRWDRTVITRSSLGHFGPAADRVPSHASNLACCADIAGAGNLQNQ
jgi:hypothetical protein